MLRDHDRLVSTAGMDGEVTRVVIIQFADGSNLEKYFIGLDLGQKTPQVKRCRGDLVSWVKGV